MLLRAPPMSNLERQRLFQERHPGYDRRRKARQRGMLKRLKAQWKAAWLAAAAAARQPQPAPLAIPRIPQRLMLPAPVEDLMVAEIDALAARAAAARAEAMLPVR